MKVLYKLACEPSTMMLIIDNYAAGECAASCQADWLRCTKEVP